MNWKSIHIILLICFAILIKLLFFTFALVVVQDNSKMASLITNDAFKIRNKRRRIIYSIIHPKEIAIKAEYNNAEKKETEDYNELFKKFKLPRLSFFTDYISDKVIQTKTIISDFSEACFYPPSSRKYLSISILRI
jgi:hypothetical protein